MEGPKFPPVFDPPVNGPSSPPVTPGTLPNPQFIHASGQSAPNWNAFLNRAQSPPLEHIQPTGQGHHFFYTRPQWIDPESRPSTASGIAFATRDEGSVVGTESVSEGPPPYEDRPITALEDADFELEEVEENDSWLGSGAEVVRPDDVEEPNAQGSGNHDDDAGVATQFQDLNCYDDTVGSDEERKRRYLQKKKRWSQGLFKRTHSQSIGSDTDDMDDTEGMDAQSVGSSTRRLRRRVRGPGDRSSLIFEDLGSTHINEEKEPGEAHSGMPNGSEPPSLPSDQEGLGALPFWVLQDPMEIDSGSSHPSSVS
ncbi:uncharacterized protein K452DRAFT_303960 [Aplosporella prunicola CBS 121167]|uniref:Uncharacterized protein n=1 Tax=Aplosporella prunicola CBS 121167 TaxID=1176127 RepID=A0A6A6BWG9_9PEZI|nr:uncharacterized protein K452DRAFT_303960 [Aplosporella prunicola CBS 121167]KAF2147061.1 hypothetical protein K452DRAFT_303960 [Aplosporella prunicola CBS 121167]